MAESSVTSPIYLDETAKANGGKLDLLNATLLGMSASLGVLAKGQTGILRRWIITPSRPLWTLAAPRSPSPPAPSW